MERSKPEQFRERRIVRFYGFFIVAFLLTAGAVDGMLDISDTEQPPPEAVAFVDTGE